MKFLKIHFHKLVLTSVFIIGLSGNIVFAQFSSGNSVFRSPRLIVELTGSFNVPIGDARGELADFFTFKNYGLVHGIGFDLSLKYAANRSATLYPYFTAGFSHLQNSDENLAYIDSNRIANGYPLGGNAVFNPTPGSSLLVIKDFHLGVGLQYAAGTKHPVFPFGGFTIDYDYVWGFYQQTARIVAGGGEANQITTFDINHAHRFGIGVDLGLNYRITPSLGFVFGTRYKIANLFGKKSEQTGNSATDPANLNSMNLLDKSAPELNSNLNSNRNLSYLQFYIGFSVFAGKR